MTFQGNTGSKKSHSAAGANLATTPHAPTTGTKASAYEAVQSPQTAAGVRASPRSSAVSAMSLQPSTATAGAVETAASPAVSTGTFTTAATASGSDTGQSQASLHSSSRAGDDDDDNDFGDFGGAAVAAVPATAPAAAAVPQSTAAHAAARQDGDDDDDDFGDFDAAPSAAAANTQVLQTVATTPHRAATAARPIQTTAAQAAADDDFGDFGHASATTTAPAAAGIAGDPARVAAVQPAAQPPAVAAVPEGPDILALSGAEFLSTVLDAWQVLGAPDGYKAAAAHQPQQTTRGQHHQQQHPITPTLPWASESSLHSSNPSSIMALNGIPWKLLQTPTMSSSSSNGSGLAAAVEVPQQLSCRSDLEWSGSASEARLVDGLGLRQAVDRALAAQAQDAARRKDRQQQQEAVR